MIEIEHIDGRGDGSGFGFGYGYGYGCENGKCQIIKNLNKGVLNE